MRRRLHLLCLPLLLSTLAAAQISGSVVNGTSGKPVARVQVSLVAFQQGIQPSASTRTDAQGHFQFAAAAPSANSPVMVRADYLGVPYFLMLQAGESSANLTVYEVSADAAKIHVAAQVVVVQPEKAQLAVVDEFQVVNHLKRTLYHRGGLFRFRIPRNVSLDGAQVVGPSGFPIKRNAEPSSAPGEFLLDYPIRPGETRFQISYRLPYATQKAQLAEDPIFPTDHLVVFVPPPMTFTGTKFSPLPSEQGYNVYEAQASNRGPVRFTVAGMASLPPEMQADAAGASGGAAASGSSTAAPTPTVGPVASKTWMEKNGLGVLAVLLILAGTALAWLLARPKSAPAGATVVAASAPPAPPLAPPSLGAAADAADGGSAAQLAQLKDDLFLLEVQRHTGHMDEAAYARARQAIDERMQSLRLG